MLLNPQLKEQLTEQKGLFLSHMMFVVLLILSYFVLNGMRQEEQLNLSVVKNDYNLIKTHSDKRKNNIFASTPEFTIRLFELLPDVDAFINGGHTLMNFSYPQENRIHRVEREVPLILIGPRYFDAFNGEFLQGRGFDKKEVFSGKPLIVLSEGAIKKIFGNTHERPSQIWINGMAYQVAGVWKFETDKIEENDAIFLPLGLTHVFGKDSQTYINNFILKGTSSAALLRLKKAIDQIQLSTGHSVIRPEFSIDKPKVSRKTFLAFLHNKVYIDLLIWLSFLLYLYFSYRQNYQWFSFSQDWATWSFMSGMNAKAMREKAIDDWMKLLTLSTASATILAMLILGFMHFAFKFTLASGSVLHPTVYLYLLFIPIQFWFFAFWSKKLTFKLS